MALLDVCLCRLLDMIPQGLHLVAGCAMVNGIVVRFVIYLILFRLRNDLSLRQLRS
jgi:hypothetical protein